MFWGSVLKMLNREPNTLVLAASVRDSVWISGNYLPTFRNSNCIELLLCTESSLSL